MANASPLPITCEILESESNVEVGARNTDTNKIVVKVTNTSGKTISTSGT